MSMHSYKNSVSSGKGFKRMVFGQGQNTGALQSTVQPRHPELSVSKEGCVTPGRVMKPTSDTLMTPGVRELDHNGFVIYNIPEADDIYISVPQESADFDDEGINLVKMEDDVFFGGRNESKPIEVKQAYVEPVEELQSYTQPADIFSVAIKRDDLGDIDLNEIIVKPANESDKVSDKPMFKIESDPIVDEITALKEEKMSCATSEVANPVQASMALPVSYDFEPEYGVEEITDEVEVSKEVQMETPANLYAEGNEPINGSVMGADNEVISSMVPSEERLAGAETSSTVMSMLPSSLSIIPKELAPVAEITEASGAETILNIPEFTRIEEDADMLLVVVPRLYLDEQFLFVDVDMIIPEDGLESYDAKFKIMESAVPVMSESKVSFTFEADVREMKGTRFNFTF